MEEENERVLYKREKRKRSFGEDFTTFSEGSTSLCKCLVFVWL
jgi:hypothetical protein